MDAHRRPPGYSGGRDWQWRWALGTALGTAGGVVVTSIGSAAGLVTLPRGAAGALAANAVLASACLAGSVELVRELRSGQPEDTTNALLGGAMAGYAMGSLRGGQALALSSSLAFSVLGVGLHKGVWAVQDWRLQQMHRTLIKQKNSGAGTLGSDILSPLSSASAPPSREADVQSGSATVPTSSGQSPSDTPLDQPAQGWSWPHWMPIRPATQEEIKKSQAMHEKLMRERFGEDARR